MMDINKQLASAMFSDVKLTVNKLEEMYPAREKNGGVVTRFAPSPTGYMHIGGLYVSLINESFAETNDGTFYLRIEDTDQARLVENGVTEIINTLNNFDIKFNEGPANETDDFGNYGPYRQAIRKEIYQTYAKHMVENGLAYPCFCTKEELEEIRLLQEQSNSSVVGYSGEFAKYRDYDTQLALNRVLAGESFVVRLRSPHTTSVREQYQDIVRGTIEMEANLIDTVLIKGDGLPTYHFAHIIDDHFMRTTHVIRGEEWLASLPLHIQMFNMLNWTAPKYAHVCPILKLDGDSKRKLSKRKDPEARVGYYFEQGFPVNSVKEYLLTLINSNYEEWRIENPDVSFKEFKIELDKMSKSGPLFDNMKLLNISKRIIKNMSDEQVFEEVFNWSKTQDKDLHNYIVNNKDKFLNSIKIWHENRMDIAMWSELSEQCKYLYDNQFAQTLSTINFDEYKQKPQLENILKDFAAGYDSADDSATWFAKVKDIASNYNYALKGKEYKENPELYNGMLSDVATFIRLAVVGKKDSPDLHQILQFLGESEVLNRVNAFVKNINN